MEVSGIMPDGQLFATTTNTEGVMIAEVEAALLSLGYRDKEAQQAIKAARSASDKEI